MLVMNHIGNKKGTLDERNRPLVEAQGYLGVPVAAHWYNWHQIPFDNQHPNFFPAKPGIPEQVKDLVQKGFIVMPYTNARLVDSNNSDFSDVLPHTIKDRLGKFNLEIYGNHSGRMAPICPHTKFWQDKVTSFVERGADEVGVNAVYLDQISAECPVLCYDDSHGHPLGGGHWWVDAYQKLLVQVQAAAHKDGRNMVITTECAAEPYMKGVDAYLIWVNRDIRDIPMITAVYSGYSLYIGSPAAFEHGDRAWIAVQGQAFLWGAQNGWMGLELFAPENINKREYFRRIGQYRVALKAYLTYGELLGPIKPAGTVSTFREIWPRSYGNPLQRINISGDEENQGTLAFDKNETSDDVDAPIVELPSLDGAIWKSEAGTLCLLLVNFLEEENAFELELDLSAYGVVPGVKGYSLWIVEPEGKRKAGTLATPVVKQTERLGRWEIRALEIKPE
jgi:hypothetical protein